MAGGTKSTRHGLRSPADDAMHQQGLFEHHGANHVVGRAVDTLQLQASCAGVLTADTMFQVHGCSTACVAGMQGNLPSVLD